MTAPADIARASDPHMERGEDTADALTGMSIARAPESAAGDIPTEIAVLRETIAKLTELNSRQAAQLAELAGPVEYLALRACDRGGYTCETLRMWCKTGAVASRREGGRLFVNTRSLAAHLKRLGLEKAIRST